MEKWKQLAFSKEEEEGITAEADEICEEEVFHRTLVGRLWTDNSFNARAFTNTMIGAWRLKSPVETHELSKNLFLFRFSTKRDMENVLRQGPWSFDRNLLVLDRVSGEEQPSALNLHYGTFWVRIYDLPLKLRTEAMARKLGGILGSFEEMDHKEAHKNGRFLRIKATIDLKQPLKRGTVVRFKEKNLRVHFKYERLPTFCFICGRLGHQLKDCEAAEDLSEEGFKDLDEQELSYGAWLRSSPLPKLPEDQVKRESNSSSCNKSLFNISSGQSRCSTKGKEKENEGGEGEVEQTKQKGGAAQSERNKQPVTHAETTNNLEIEAMAESLGAVELSIATKQLAPIQKTVAKKGRKWTRKTNTKKSAGEIGKKLELELGKRNLVDVMIIDGTMGEGGSGEKKQKGAEKEQAEGTSKPEVVLEIQHRLQQ
ncbi:uncharacterized protein LOC131637617 [Vicia villosa]|uniref:uncharacterized protein LOC131637617 n=1 Tax=Vicia villosa TaxID=3911 RepID=UPI00273C37FB|nr:uncharacterized protein LOC131637617 [Vicia villosa]